MEIEPSPRRIALMKAYDAATYAIAVGGGNPIGRLKQVMQRKDEGGILAEDLFLEMSCGQPGSEVSLIVNAMGYAWLKKRDGELTPVYKTKAMRGVVRTVQRELDRVK